MRLMCVVSMSLVGEGGLGIRAASWAGFKDCLMN